MLKKLLKVGLGMAGSVGIGVSFAEDFEGFGFGRGHAEGGFADFGGEAEKADGRWSPFAATQAFPSVAG